MTGRTPNFIFAGLFIVTFLLGFFYMSCSSKSNELQRTLEDFEERVRTLTLKNEGKQQEVEANSALIRDLENKNADFRKDVEEKDSELNNLNVQLNEKLVEIQNLASLKNDLDNQLKEAKDAANSVASKESTIEKLQKELDEQKKSNEEQMNNLQETIKNYRNQVNQSQDNQGKSIVVSNRTADQSLVSSNETINQELNNSDLHQRLQRSLNNSLFDNETLNDTGNNNNLQLDTRNAQKSINITSISLSNEIKISNNQSQLAEDNDKNLLKHNAVENPREKQAMIGNMTMTKMLNSDIIALLLLASSFQIAHIATIPCNKSNIIHSVQDDNVNITFLSTDVIRLNRSVLCTSNSSFEFINGPEYHCMRLGYGRYGQIFIQIQNDNGVVDNCSITYVTKLHVANLAHINAIADRVRLIVSRPLGSFDYVIIHCPDDKSHIIFNTSLPSNDLMMSAHCSFLLNMPLMSFVIETVKKDFDSTINHIIQEVPLPVPFTCSLDSLLLTIIANPAPTINLASRYEFNLIFHDKDNDRITYERVNILDLKLYSNTTLKYGLTPNLKHKISFDHIADSIGSAHSNLTITPISNVSYPYEVVNFSVDEQFHKIVLSWTDTHSRYDPIEFIVSCNSSQKSSINIGRKTVYTCEQMTFHETDIVSVQTKVAIPGYTHDRTAVVQINVKQVPEIPLFEVFNKTENDITIRWSYNSSSLMSNSFKYKIQCDLYEDSSDIDIHLNQYQCQSLEDGSLYVITMHLISVNNTIKRSSSIHAATLLQKCRPKNHFFISEIDGTISIVIEWIPPKHNFEKIIIYCPSTIMTYENHQVVSLMYVKCKVKHGFPLQVSFVTVKSGFEDAIFKFTDTAPSVFGSTTTPPVFDSTTTPPVFGSTTTPSVFESTTATPPAFGSTTTTQSVFESTTIRTTTIFGTTKTTSSRSTTTAASTILTTSAGTVSFTTVRNITTDPIVKPEEELTKWRTAAIIAFIVIGFLLLATIALTTFSVFAAFRKR
ncbi:unnamed protein product [Rotaria socialis]|uniref:Uncharacterized protein n=1 Tax=Rotaria socialis TaxID=392032 RepID=A0A818I8F3_9BILA|nr:unnamed protein product [Rotaria socialis]